jgi:hypothetical protein
VFSPRLQIGNGIQLGALCLLRRRRRRAARTSPASVLGPPFLNLSYAPKRVNHGVGAHEPIV